MFDDNSSLHKKAIIKFKKPITFIICSLMDYFRGSLSHIIIVLLLFWFCCCLPSGLIEEVVLPVISPSEVSALFTFHHWKKL